jgi:glycolate oxidase FAD binding subunit
MARRARGETRARSIGRMTTAVAPSTETIAARVRDAVARGTTVRIVGAGTWLDAGRPVDSAEQLSLAAHTGITEYTPGDLTLTARAGTTLGEIHDAVSPHGQWLALDPFGSDEGSIGATIATASAGPLATRFGAPRDLVLGLEFVTGLGATVRGGGRVVKNVAGFDLTRLLTGAWGTLGVITEVSVRLHARPEAEVTLAVSSNDELIDIGGVRSAIGRWPFVPLACEVVNDALGRQIGVGGAAVLFRVGGNDEAVVAQRRAIAELGDSRDMESSVWGALRTADADASLVVRLSRAPADVSSTWTDAVAIAAAHPDARVSASPTRGIVRCTVPSADGSIERAAASLAGVRSRIIAERAPAKLWSVPPLARSADPLPSRIRDAFDPRHILNHGILGSVS